MAKKKKTRRPASAAKPAPETVATQTTPTPPNGWRLALVGLFWAFALIFAWNMVFFLVIGVVLLLPLERLFKRHDQPILRPQIGTDLLHVFGTVALAAIPTAAVAYGAKPLVIGPLAEVVTAQPIWLQGIEVFFLRELCIYWAHRISHQVPLLWRFHAIHHSSEHLDWLSGQRRHPLDSFYIAVCSATPLTLAGFNPTQVTLLAAISGLWDLSIHANINWRLRWLDGIWVTQEFHHWHHVKDRADHDNNYAGAFALYDVLFGTYHMPKDRRPEDYGIHQPMPPGYFGQLAQPFREDESPASAEAKPAKASSISS